MPDAEFPDVVRIEVSSLCNFKCIHCSTRRARIKRGMLGVDSFYKILDQFKSQKFVPRVVVLYHGGEPLLNKHLPFYIAVLKRYGVKKTVITTNCSLLDAQMGEKLLLAGLDEMKVSFDGASVEENTSIRKNGDFYRDAGHLIDFLNLKMKYKLMFPKIRICNVQILSKNKLQEFANINKTVWYDPPEYLREFFKDYLSEIQFQCSVARKWVGFKDNEFLEEFAVKLDRQVVCPPLFETVSILANGDVVPCCDDLTGEVVFGNVFQESVFEIWKSESFIKFRNSFMEGHPDKFCQKCFKVNPVMLVQKKHV